MNIVTVLKGDPSALPYLAAINTDDPRARAIKRALSYYISCVSRKHKRAEKLGHLRGETDLNLDTPVGVIQPPMTWLYTSVIERVLSETTDFDRAIVLMFEQYGDTLLNEYADIREKDINEFIRQVVCSIYDELHGLY